MQYIEFSLNARILRRWLETLSPLWAILAEDTGYLAHHAITVLFERATVYGFSLKVETDDLNESLTVKVLTDAKLEDVERARLTPRDPSVQFEAHLAVAGAMGPRPIRVVELIDPGPCATMHARLCVIPIVSSPYEVDAFAFYCSNPDKIRGSEAVREQVLLSREAAYSHWLALRLAERHPFLDVVACRLESVTERVLCRRQGVGKVGRLPRYAAQFCVDFKRPDCDSDFTSLMRRGMSGHRTFGFGMFDVESSAPAAANRSMRD